MDVSNLAIFSQNISILVVLLYAWQINVNTKKFQVLGDVYWGVQISYWCIIGTQLSIVVLSIVLLIGINTVSDEMTKQHCLLPATTLKLPLKLVELSHLLT